MPTQWPCRKAGFIRLHVNLKKASSPDGCEVTLTVFLNCHLQVISVRVLFCGTEQHPRNSLTIFMFSAVPVIMIVIVGAFFVHFGFDAQKTHVHAHVVSVCTLRPVFFLTEGSRCRYPLPFGRSHFCECHTWQRWDLCWHIAILGILGTQTSVGLTCYLTLWIHGIILSFLVPLISAFQL